MASRATRRQAAITTMAMAVAKIANCRTLLTAAQACVDMIGHLPQREAKAMNDELEAFRREVWGDGVELPVVISTLLALVSDQLVHVASHRKRLAFLRLMDGLERALEEFNDDIDHHMAYQAAVVFGGMNF